MRIDIGPPAPAPTDRFLLQPVTRAANGMQRVLDDPRGLAAASPLSGDAGQHQHRHRRVAALRVVSPSADPDLNADITFTSDSGDYSWELRDRVTTRCSPAAPAAWSAAAPIALERLRAARSTACRAAAMSSASARPPYPAAEQRQRAGLLALRDSAFVGRVTLAGGGLGGGTTITDAYAAAHVRRRRARAERRRGRRHVQRGGGAGRQPRSSTSGRQPRRRGRAADPVPAELPGRRQDAAGGAVACSTPCSTPPEPETDHHAHHHRQRLRPLARQPAAPPAGAADSAGPADQRQARRARQRRPGRRGARRARAGQRSRAPSRASARSTPAATR